MQRAAIGLVVALCAPATAQEAHCPPGETIQWIADHCMARMQTDDEIAVAACIDEAGRLQFDDACTARRHFKRLLCEDLVATGGRPGTVEACVADAAFAGSTVRNGGVGSPPQAPAD